MKLQPDFRPLGCAECARGTDLGFDFTMAFQPIVNIHTREIFAQEALVRGLNNESAGVVFEHVREGNLYRFDQSCRVKAIELAAQLAISSQLSINFMPNAVYQPELCIRTTLAAAREYQFPIERIIFEITEGEKITDLVHLREIVTHYQRQGFKVALDDFGAGYSGLNLLADLHADIIKLDMVLIRNIHSDQKRQIIVRGILQVCQELGSKVVAEGVETRDEMLQLKDMGVELFQGYYFAKPAFRSLAAVNASCFPN